MSEPTAITTTSELKNLTPSTEVDWCDTLPRFSHPPLPAFVYAQKIVALIRNKPIQITQNDIDFCQTLPFF